MTLTANSLAQAMGNSSGVNYTTLLPAVNAALLQAGCTNINRAAMFLAQLGEESGGLRWMEEIASGSAYEGRCSDLGNCSPGDGVRYKGRGPIQITGKAHYANLSQWAYGKGLCPSATYFVDNPTALALVQYGFLGAVWYWTVARPQLNALSDAGDILGATKAINGGTNGLQDRTDRWNRCRAMGDAILPAPTGATVSEPKPDFNEYANWGTNSSSRGGTTVDLFLLHTNEGDNNADSLAKFLISTEGGANPVAYHYCVSEDYNDHGVTVVDVIDTDYASWSVGNSNARSINLCFAGSRAAWTTDQWMQQSKAIDVAAYLAVQDCRKYGIKIAVIPPPYSANPPGIADHRYCTQRLRDGNNHTDVGDNFPWPYFTDRVNFWAAGSQSATTPAVPAPAQPPAPPARRWPDDYTDRELMNWIVAQLGPGDPSWASKGATLRDKVWSLGKDS